MVHVVSDNREPSIGIALSAALSIYSGAAASSITSTTYVLPQYTHQRRKFRPPQVAHPSLDIAQLGMPRVYHA